MGQAELAGVFPQPCFTSPSPAAAHTALRSPLGKGGLPPTGEDKGRAACTRLRRTSADLHSTLQDARFVICPLSSRPPWLRTPSEGARGLRGKEPLPHQRWQEEWDLSPMHGSRSATVSDVISQQNFLYEHCLLHSLLSGRFHFHYFF